MQQLTYTIDNNPHHVQIEGDPIFKTGESIRHSRKDTDITYDQPWYEKGHASKQILSEEDFKALKLGLTHAVAQIISEELGKDASAFSLERYHDLVKTDEEHYKIVGRTRDLFPDDFNFPIEEMIIRFEKILGFDLTDVNSRNGKKIHIIVRINRPGSTDYNPPHKDVYEAIDIENWNPPMVNLWIPVAGVTSRSSLPIAPGSHLLPEDQVLRTREGGEVAGKKYRVRMIQEWGGSNAMTRASVENGQALFFSSHLIHGLAINEEPDTTRVSLEFRLLKK